MLGGIDHSRQFYFFVCQYKCFSHNYLEELKSVSRTDCTARLEDFTETLP